MAQQTASTEMSMDRARFRAFSENLRLRGFSDRKPASDEMVRFGAGGSMIMAKSFTGFDIVCGAREDLTHAARDIAAGLKAVADLPLSTWARFECEGGGSVALLTHTLNRKSHYNASGRVSRWDHTYAADLVPADDAGLLIRNCIALGDAIERIRKDGGYREGLEAKEIFDALSAALKGISDGNSLRAGLKAGLDSYILGWWNKYAYETERLKLDAGLISALAAVADR